MGIFDYLNTKAKSTELQKNRERIYWDIACILWYNVLSDDVLSFKKDKMVQNEQFAIFQFGNKFLRFGPCKELNSKECIDAFESKAKKELRDRGYKVKSVRAYLDGIVVELV